MSRNPLLPDLRRRALTGTLGLALGLSAIAPAHADVKTALYSGPSQFIYEIIHMPDFDQRRGAGPGIPGLPGNGGMYCVPTSTMNLMAYIANHGYPTVYPGAGYWQGNGKYNEATDAIKLAGALMSTSASDGTNGNGWQFGALVLTASTGKFVSSLYGASGNWAPTQKSMTQTAMNGAIVSFAYGRYEKVGTYLGLPLLDRDGGHAVTLTRSMASGASRAVFCRDPADNNDGMITTQSLFGDRMMTVEDHAVATGASIGQIKLMSAFNYDAGNSKHAYLDGYLAIRPKAGYSFKPGGDGSYKIQLLKPWSFLGHSNESEFNMDISVEIIDAVMGPDWNNFFVLTDSTVAGSPDKDLLKLNMITGEQKKLLSLNSAKGLVFGRKRDVYAHSSNQLFHFEIQDDIKPTVFNIGYPITSIAFDDDADQLIAFSLGAKKILRFAEGLIGEPQITSIPSSVPMSGDGSVLVNPTNGKTWIWTEKTPAIYEIDVLPTGLVVANPFFLPGINQPTSFDFDDHGHLFVVENNRTTEFEMIGEAWQATAEQPWNAFVTGKTFDIMRSRTNWVPEMDEEKQQHIDPSELTSLVGSDFIPDCDEYATNKEYGAGKAGSNGVPHLFSTTPPYIGVSSGFTVENALPGAFATLVLGVQATNLPFDGGLLLASPNIVLPLPIPVAADGTLTINGTIPADPTLCGVDLFHQVLIPDPAASGFYKLALSNGLKRTLGS